MNRCPNHISLTLLHGFQSEPTETADNNLARIRSLKNRYNNIDIGFMDHSVGIGDEAFYLPMIALGQEVNCIEKHITLDYSLEIEDYVSALSVDRFKQFTSLIRKYECALGSSSMEMSDKEIEYKLRSGKVIVAARDIDKDTTLKESDLAMKRFSTVFYEEHFRKMASVIGKTTTVKMAYNQPVSREFLT